MSWTLFCQIVILAMLVYIVVYALIETYLQKKLDKDLEFYDVTSANKRHNHYKNDKFGG